MRLPASTKNAERHDRIAISLGQRAHARHFENELAALLVDPRLHRSDQIAEGFGLALQHAANLVRHRFEALGGVAETDGRQQAFEEIALQLLADACFEPFEIGIIDAVPDRPEQFEQHRRLRIGDLRKDGIELGAEAADRFLAEGNQMMRLDHCQPVPLREVADLAGFLWRKNDRHHGRQAAGRKRGHQTRADLEGLHIRRIWLRHAVNPFYSAL